MINDEVIKSNKERFIELVKTIDVLRPGNRITELIEKLERSDFFYAPCSTKYHLNCKGGLCQHSLNVYDNLKTLVKTYEISDIDESAILITALFHDISKMNFYMPSYKNVKVYSEDGDKQDNLGRFSWVSQESFVVRDVDKRFVYSTHGANSEYIIRQYINLTLEESCAIINHMCGMDNNTSRESMWGEIYNDYKLASLLHIADMISSYITEVDNE